MTTQQAQHTPGPWKVDGKRILADVERGEYRVFPIAYLNIIDPDHEAVANACLIAAAPELLAACQAEELAREVEAEVVDNGDLSTRNSRAAVAEGYGDMSPQRYALELRAKAEGLRRAAIRAATGGAHDRR